jgi:hypothetical protein
MHQKGTFGADSPDSGMMYPHKVGLPARYVTGILARFVGLSLRTWSYDTPAPKGAVSAVPLSGLCVRIAGELHAIAEANLGLASDPSHDRETEHHRSVPDEASEDPYSVPQAGSGSQSNHDPNPHQAGSPAVRILRPDRQESSEHPPRGAKRKTSDLVLPNQIPLLEEAS